MTTPTNKVTSLATVTKQEALQELNTLTSGLKLEFGNKVFEVNFENSFNTIRDYINGGGWMPIETAPHGIWIIIYAYKTVAQACWNSNGWWDTFNGNRLDHSAAECWQPLPTPPESGNI